MTCRDHAEPIEDCCGCACRWDSAMAERAIEAHDITGIAAATIRAAIAELDAHATAVAGEHTDGAPCLECEVRALRRQIVAERLERSTEFEQACDVIRSYREQRDADLVEATATYEATREEIEALRCGDLGAYFDGELSVERRDAFDRHLATCKACAAELLVQMRMDVVLGDAANATRKRGSNG